MELEAHPESALWIDWALVSEKADNLVEKAMTSKSRRSTQEDD